MVEVMRAPTFGGSLTGPIDMTEVSSRFSDVKLSAIHETEESAAQDTRKETSNGSWKKGPSRAPRRAYSSNDYHLPSPAGSISRSELQSPASRPSEPSSYFSLQPTLLSSIPGTPTEPAHSPSVALAVQPGYAAQRNMRPALPSPQRSYSVMDYVPVPILQRPGEKLRLVHLPPELHFAIFDWLDDIDSTCLGLTSKNFYAIHRRMRGSVALSARREGPNDMEWAWRLAGPLIAAGQSHEKAMAQVLPRGQVYCRKCGITRCELHKHIQDWMGDGYEYCDVRQKFGPPAAQGARKTCYRSSPRHPHRCGRHTRQQRTVRLV
ncbi:uncharacterized protein JN550_001786 [Neoarthrinium moseri]|uniref:uncharacterized protein n=1 Tax=Neoarthrinium moseri TaxID=1658444 RepID=UPI001FDD6F33|nr:uncharacterized protein JN550_001786 [Neoarthrinium moseri]KAI1876290.1 hypothetical protein JN550_001786 [Neoarthrinium moseri]